MSKLEGRIAYDLVGSEKKAVALIWNNFKSNRKIAREIMKRHKAVKSVLKKISVRKGKFRLYRTRLVLGSKNTEVVHKEYGYFLKLDPRRVFFSPREGNERQKISRMIKRGEKVLVMFCGAAPYIIAIAKAKKAEKIVGIEINPIAVRYARENLRLNKISNADIFLGDVRKFKGGKFDRIVMPFIQAINYLDVAFAHSKKGTIIHLYGTSSLDMKDFEETIKSIAKDLKVRLKIIGKEKVLPYAPRVLKVRFDLKVL